MNSRMEVAMQQIAAGSKSWLEKEIGPLSKDKSGFDNCPSLYGQKYQAEVDSHGKAMSVSGR